MAIKMRYLYFSGKPKYAEIGNHLKAKYDLQINSVDRIPPAYSCDKERIVVLGISAKNELPDPLRLFCRELTKARTANVALILDGNKAAEDAVIKTIKEAGTNVAGETLYISGGFPIFGNKLSEEETAKIDSWLDAIIESLAGPVTGCSFRQKTGPRAFGERACVFYYLPYYYVIQLLLRLYCAFFIVRRPCGRPISRRSRPFRPSW